MITVDEYVAKTRFTSKVIDAGMESGMSLLWIKVTATPVKVRSRYVSLMVNIH